jgi:hypothetical protein
MADNCKGCGAPANPNMTICEFCGAATVELKGLADELKAIDDMVALEQKVRREVDLSDKGQVGSYIYRTAQSEAGIEVMTGSFIPQYPEALKKLIQIIIGKAMAAPSGYPAKDQFVGRARSLISAYRLNCSDDPNYYIILEQYEEELEEQEAKTGTKHNIAMLKKIGIGIAIVIVAILFLQLSITAYNTDSDDTIEEKKCTDESEEYCDTRCQLANCLKVCERGENWACQLSKTLKP